jgi:hypothetical protein
MIENYFLFTSKLFAPIVSVLDADLVMPNWKQPRTFKGDFLAVFFLFLTVPTAIKTIAKKLTNSAFKSQITSRNYLLDSAAIAGRGGGGGGGHGGFVTRKIRDHDSFQGFFLRDIKINDYNLI